MSKLVFLAVAMVAFTFSLEAQAKTFTVPSYNPYSTFSSEPFGKCYCRYQQIYASQDIKVGPCTLKNIAFDGVNSSVGHLLDMQIDFGMTAKGPSVMSSTYANNITSPLSTVLSRAKVSLPSLPTKSSYGVKFPFAKPFQYDGKSNLIFEVRVYNNDNNNQNFYYDLRTAYSPYLAYVSTVKGVNATQGSLSGNWGLAAKFEYGQSTFTPYGVGCKGEGGYIPAIANLGLPRVGQSFQLFMNNATGSRNAWVLVGRSKASWGPLTLPFDLTPLGFQGCNLYCDALTMLPALTQGGTAGTGYGQLLVSIPAYPNLIGAKLYFQWAVAVPVASGFTLAFSNGGEAQLDI